MSCSFRGDKVKYSLGLSAVSGNLNLPLFWRVASFHPQDPVPHYPEDGDGASLQNVGI
jgi:hypothetical protein